MTLEETIEKIRKFRDDRNWMQFHNPKNMAIAISLEASELLEHFQWKTLEESAEYSQEAKNEIQKEMADIAIYLFELADNLKINLVDAMNEKIAINDAKYPVEKARNSSKKYTEL